MKVKKTIPILFGIFILVLSTLLLSQTKTKVEEIPKDYKRWLNEEVFYIITSVEKEVFLKLQNNRERDLFFKAFWKQRDPTPGTEKNEFREEHFRRLIFVNKRFRGTGKSGWETDRGKVYVILGPPKDIRIFHSTDAYYPSEVWYYQGLVGFGLPQAFHLLFFQKGRIGDYVIYNPAMDGPWSLMANYWGDPGNYLESYYALDNIEPELARISLSLIPGESVINYPSLSSATLIQNIDYAAVRKIKDKYAQKFLEYKDIIEVEYSVNYTESESQIQVIQGESGIYFVHFSIELQNISMGRFEDSIYTNLEFNGIITDKQKNTIFQFEKSVPLTFTAEQFEKMRQRPFSFTEVFPLVPGDYKFSLLVKNSVSKEFTSFERELRIPQEKKAYQMSPLLLGFNAVRATSPQNSNHPFVIENTQIYSQPEKSFLQEDNLIIFFQILNLPEIVKETGSLTYVITKEDEEYFTLTHSLDKYQSRLNFIEPIPLKKFVPGYYKIRVSLLDGKKNEISGQQENFEISPVTYIPRPWVIANSLIESDEPHISYILGRQLINKKDYVNAYVWLEKAHRIEPNYFDYGFYLAQVNFYLKKYKEAIETLSTFSDKGKDNYEFNYLMAKSYQALSEFDKAIKIFDEAILYFGLNVNLLNSLGECYSKLGNKTKALVVLEKSLEINPNQETIKKLILSIKRK